MNACVDCGRSGGIGGNSGRDTHGGGDRGEGGGEGESDGGVGGREDAVGTGDVVIVEIGPAQCLQGGTESN